MPKVRTSYKKGQSGNPNGRPKGAKNRSTDEIRQFIQMVVDKNLTRLEEDLDNMNPATRWMVIDKVAKYFMPTLTKNDNTNNNQGGMIIRVVYDDTPPAPQSSGNE